MAPPWPRSSWSSRGRGTCPIQQRELRTLRLTLGYRGSRYAGWARQKASTTAGRDTLQGVLEMALAAVLRHPTRVTAAGRTDAGVHAEGQVVSFETSARLPAERLPQALAAHLPDDVWVVSAAEAQPGFNARRLACRRWYRYAIWQGPSRVPVAWRGRALVHPRPLDLAAMRQASAALVGRHDFQSFVSGWTRDQRSWRRTTRTIYAADWLTSTPRGAGEERLLEFEICADAFLRQMVRTVVGSLLRVGQGAWTPDHLAATLAACDRSTAGPAAPAEGLTLWRIEYADG